MSDSKKLPATSSNGEIQSFLQQLSRTPKVTPAGRKGRLVFALDATASREPTWREASRIQAEMFATASSLGGLEIQLCHYRGPAEFRASPWLSRSEDLARRMAEVECLCGQTQIGRMLEHTLAEARRDRIAALVFVGDCMEEDTDTLYRSAGELALLGVKAFLFQEGHDPAAGRTFEQIAKITRGAHCRFDAGSARQLRDLLGAVAAYAAGGFKALENFSRSRGGLALQLTHRMTKS